MNPALTVGMHTFVLNICMLRCYRYDLLLADEATPFEVQVHCFGSGHWVELGVWCFGAVVCSRPYELQYELALKRDTTRPY